MRPSSVDPFTPDPSDLHPMLQKALDNLDVQLEDELTRYRQNRYRQSGKKTRVQDLGQTARRSDAPRQIAQASFTPVLPSYANGDDYQSDRHLPSSLESDVWATEAPLQPPLQPNLSTFDARQVVREMRPPASISQSAPQPELTDDYFASSEELLKSFASPEAIPIRRQPTLLDQLLTPLGVGSMLLILLSSASLGYVLMHPASLSVLATLGRGGNESSTASALPTDNQSLSPNLASDEFIDVNLNTLSQLPRNDRPSTVVTVPQTNSPGLPASPDASTSIDSSNPPGVATTEAPRLSAAVSAPPLQTVTIPAEPVVPQAAAPAPRSVPAAPRPAARSAAPAAPRAVAPRPAAAPRTAAAPRSAPATTSTISVLPAPAPAARSAPALISEAPPAVSSRYYVVTEYTGDPSLSQARQAIGDAYVRNFDDGAKVQMGSFSDAASAEQLVRRLQQQGVPAQVYQP